MTRTVILLKKRNNCVPFEVYNKKKQHLFKAFDDGLKEQTKQTVYIIKASTQ